MQIPRGPRGPYVTRIKEREEEIARALAAGRSAPSLARELGCHHDTILAVARRRGLHATPDRP